MGSRSNSSNSSTTSTVTETYDNSFNETISEVTNISNSGNEIIQIGDVRRNALLPETGIPPEKLMLTVGIALAAGFAFKLLKR